MSGITGIYNLDGRPVDYRLLKSMTDSIAHRGPDGSGVRVDGPVGLGHQMLCTTPESLYENLPLTNKTRNLSITADARIDNRDELISTLNLNGKPRGAITDSEIILAAYEKWNELCPSKLLGDFAFAIWDGREKKLFCARDPIGIKPFYYFHDVKTFCWASEPKAIFESETIIKEANLPLMCSYLLNRFEEREEMLYQNILRLPPSHCMIVNKDSLQKVKYWDINPKQEIRYQHNEEYEEHFLSLFKEAVRARLRSQGPVGILLSGGVDSSSIASMIQFFYDEGIIPNNGYETFSILFNRFPCNEQRYIDEVVRKFSIHANYFIFEEHLSSVDFEQTDQYFDVGHFQNLLLFAPAFNDARQKGIRVMFNGIGGDELFAAGFDHLTDLVLQRKIREFIVQLKHDSIQYSYTPYLLFLNYCLKPLIPQSIKIFMKQVLKPFHGNGVPPWINTKTLQKNGIFEHKNPRINEIKFPTHAQQCIYRGLWNGWNSNVAMEMSEQFSSYFGIENLYPFFDRRMVEFSLSIPEEQRWHGEWSKAVVRRALKGILPEAIEKRKDKADFSSIVDWDFKVRQSGKIEELITTSALGDLGMINVDKLFKYFMDYKVGKIPYAKSNYLQNFVWLELWYRSQWNKIQK